MAHKNLPFYLGHVTPDLCSARFMLHCEPGVDSVGGVFGPVVSSAIAVFEQMWCVDWLRTAPLWTIFGWQRPATKQSA